MLAFAYWGRDDGARILGSDAGAEIVVSGELTARLYLL